MRCLSRMFFIVFGLQFLAGCAGLTASISSQNALGRNIDRAGLFYFSVPDGATTDDRKIIQAFIDEFRVRGLRVASESSRTEADYVVAVAFAEKSSVTTGSMPISQAQFSTIRNVNGLAVGFVQTGLTSDVPYSIDYRVRTVYVSLFAVDGMGASDPMQPVWDGHIRAGAKALSSHSRCIVRELVSRLGIEYHAQTRIDIACRNR